MCHVNGSEGDMIQTQLKVNNFSWGFVKVEQKMGSCVVQQQISINESELSEAIHEPLNEYKQEWNENLENYIGTGFKGNGYQYLLYTLQNNLSSLLPQSLIFLIAEFCHISLKEPSNTGHQENKERDAFETMDIDSKNSLLLHYIPDSNIFHYHQRDWSTFDRYDYVQCYPSFNSVKTMKEDSNLNEYGNIIYFEISLKFKSEIIEFVESEGIIISIGLRSDIWRLYTNDKTLLINGGMIGWTQESIGFHSDDGKIFIEKGKPGITTMVKSYGQNNLKNDVIGCGYNYNQQTVFFTKNGKLIYYGRIHFIQRAFHGVMAIKASKDIFSSNLYQQMKERGEDAECLFEFNFGDKPFEFNIDSYNQQTFHQ